MNSYLDVCIHSINYILILYSQSQIAGSSSNRKNNILEQIPFSHAHVFENDPGVSCLLWSYNLTGDGFWNLFWIGIVYSCEKNPDLLVVFGHTVLWTLATALSTVYVLAIHSCEIYIGDSLYFVVYTYVNGTQRSGCLGPEYTKVKFNICTLFTIMWQILLCMQWQWKAIPWNVQNVIWYQAVEFNKRNQIPQQKSLCFFSQIFPFIYIFSDFNNWEGHVELE